MTARNEEARERKKERDRLRQRRIYAEKQARAEAEAREARHTPDTDQRHEPKGSEPERGGGARVLAVMGIPTPAAVARGEREVDLYYSSSNKHLRTPTYTEWLDMPRERLPEPATLVTPTSRRSFNPGELADIIRVARLAADELGVSENDLREALSRVDPGRTFTLRHDTTLASASVPNDA